MADCSVSPWLDVWTRWDGRWYLSVVKHGYSYHPGEQSNVAFAPLLPALMKIGGVFLGQDNETGWLIAGVIVSNLALLAALTRLIHLVRLDFDAATAVRSAHYLLFFPTSPFLSAVYPQSLFLALAIAALYAARRGHWWVAGALGGLTALARPHGVSILIPLALEHLAQRHALVTAGVPGSPRGRSAATSSRSPSSPSRSLRGRCTCTSSPASLCWCLPPVLPGAPCSPRPGTWSVPL